VARPPAPAAPTRRGGCPHPDGTRHGAGTAPRPAATSLSGLIRWGFNEKRPMRRIGRSSWRWRESNPRPSTPSQGFSGCSLLGVLLGPGAHAGKSPTGPVTVRCPGRLRDRAGRSASYRCQYRAGGAPGL